MGIEHYFIALQIFGTSKYSHEFPAVVVLLPCRENGPKLFNFSEGLKD